MPVVCALHCGSHQDQQNLHQHFSNFCKYYANTNTCKTKVIDELIDSIRKHGETDSEIPCGVMLTGAGKL